MFSVPAQNEVDKPYTAKNERAGHLGYISMPISLYLVAQSKLLPLDLKYILATRFTIINLKIIHKRC
jgi:hypothetical protein